MIFVVLAAFVALTGLLLATQEDRTGKSGAVLTVWLAFAFFIFAAILGGYL